MASRFITFTPFFSLVPFLTEFPTPSLLPQQSLALPSFLFCFSFPPTTMNWTEGTLARFSRGKGWNQEAAQQKKYFAKGRLQRRPSARTSAPHTSGFVPDHITKSQPQSTHISSEEQSSPTRRPTQSRSKYQPGIMSYATAPNVPVLPMPPFEATAYGQPAQTASDLETKRRRLLQQDDWTGIEFQRPIRVEYASQHQLPTDRRPRSFQVGPTNQRFALQQAARRRSKHNRKPEVRLCIGGTDLRWDHQNNTITSVGSGAGSLTTIEDWRAQNGISSPVDAINESRWNKKSPRLSGLRDSSSTIDYTEQRPKCIVRASPELHHPRPHTVEVKKALGKWLPSDDDEDSDESRSNIAQASQQSPAFQEHDADNAQWQQWLGHT